jgi:murein DD-endopeptidase MepM/ murein hydrolase activator NlpD
MRSNRISDPTKLRAGTSIFIPTVSASVPPQTTAVGALAWPLGGRITAKFGPRGERSYHEGIDIDGHGGEEIKAAASGVVTQSGSRGKYGRIVTIDHGDGLATLYAHIGKLRVGVGDRVEIGDPIGEVGRSGNATGTHLHFEVHDNGRPVDPIRYLQSDALVRASHD